MEVDGVEAREPRRAARPSPARGRAGRAAAPGSSGPRRRRSSTGSPSGTGAAPAVDVGGEHRHLVPPRRQRLAQPVDGADRPAMAPGGEVGGDHVEDFHGSPQQVREPPVIGRPGGGLRGAAAGRPHGARRRPGGAAHQAIRAASAAASPTGTIQPVFPSVDQILGAHHLRDQDRHARGQRLRHHHAVGVVARGEHQASAAPQLRRQRRLRQRAQDVDAASADAVAVPAGGPSRRGVRPGAAGRARARRRAPGERRQQQIEPLAAGSSRRRRGR